MLHDGLGARVYKGFGVWDHEGFRHIYLGGFRKKVASVPVLVMFGPPWHVLHEASAPNRPFPVKYLVRLS